MDEIKAVLGSYYTWLALGFAAIVGVWWALLPGAITIGPALPTEGQH